MERSELEQMTAALCSPVSDRIFPTITMQREGQLMPSYDFKCVKCNKKFSLTMGIKERETKRLKCPKCGAGKPEPIFSTFFAKTSRKS